jgi:hypothetical protein
MKSDAKHQLDHPDLGDFLGKVGVRNQSRRKRSD